MAKKSNKISINKALLNVIAPLGLEIKRNKLIIGENLAAIYAIVQYPLKPSYGWLARLTNIPRTVAAITIRPIDNGDFADALSKGITRNRSEAENEKDPRDRQRAKKAAEDGERILRQIDQDGETMVMMSSSIMPVAKEKELFEKSYKKAESTCKTTNCKPRILANVQEQAFKQISPFYTTEDVILQMTEKPTPLSAFVGGFPFANSGYSDRTGYYFGKDADGQLSLLDTWKRGEDRTNTNFVIMGVPGTGKSTAIKHIMLSEYMIGTKIICIDPENEYKKLCSSVNGDNIDAGGGTNGRINPLQIRPVPKPVDEDEEEELYEDEGYGMGPMALHMKTLDVFFALYIPSLTDMQKSILKKSLIELYNKFNIYWDTDIEELRNEDFPIFSDLHELLEKKTLEIANNETEAYCKEDQIKEYYKLTTLLEDLAKGSDQFLWNGHTTVETSSRCICLNTNKLQEMGENIKRAQYFNLLTWCWQEMSRNREEKVLLVCDEAYLMIDPNVPQSLVFLRNVEKRARKYEAGVAIVSHSVVDFLDPQIKMYGQALLDAPCFKILMGTDGQNLEETCKIYKLTEAEEALLAQKKRGTALCMIGSKRLQINFEIPEYKFRYMGKGGGR